MNTDIRDYCEGIDSIPAVKYFACYCFDDDLIQEDIDENSKYPEEDFDPEQCNNCQYGTTDPYWIQYYISPRGDKLYGVRYPVAIGGPNVIVDTFDKKVYGNWAFRKCEVELEEGWCDDVNGHFDMYIEAFGENYDYGADFVAFYEYYKHNENNFIIVDPETMEEMRDVDRNIAKYAFMR